MDALSDFDKFFSARDTHRAGNSSSCPGIKPHMARRRSYADALSPNVWRSSSFFSSVGGGVSLVGTVVGLMAAKNC